MNLTLGVPNVRLHDKLCRLLIKSRIADDREEKALQLLERAREKYRVAETTGFAARDRIEAEMRRLGTEDVVVEIGGRRYRLWIEEGLGIEEVAPEASDEPA